LLLDYLLKLPNKNELILFTDAFDCIVFSNLDSIETKFNKLNYDFVVSTEDYYFQSWYFGEVKNNNINTGLLLGRASVFITILLETLTYRDGKIMSNQKLWTITLNQSLELQSLNILYDNKNVFFKNLLFYDTIYKIINQKLYLTKTKTYLDIIQGNGNNIDVKISEFKVKESIGYFWGFTRYYIFPYKMKY
jgi:hypothetical protein